MGVWEKERESRERVRIRMRLFQIVAPADAPIAAAVPQADEPMETDADRLRRHREAFLNRFS